MPRGTEADRKAGRAYLVGRGIAPAAMDAAEACGMLRYVACAVLFVGYDGRQPKSATRRGYMAGDPMPKRDLSGSDDPQSDASIVEQWCIRSSKAFGVDLSRYWAVWAVPVPPTCARSSSSAPAASRPKS